MVALGMSVFLLAGCGSKQESQNSVQPSGVNESSKAQSTSENSTEKSQLTLSVAASLTDCMEDMQVAYNELYPNTSLQFNFGASGTLQQQIEQGAPADIFFSAGVKQMKTLEEAGLVDSDTSEELLINKLVLVKPSTLSSEVTFDTLSAAEIEKIAIGEPESVPAGQYATEVLNYLKLTSQIENKLVYAKDVREVLSWVETGNAQAGMVYETDALTTDQVIICDYAPEEAYSPIVYPIGIVSSTQNLEAAKTFIDFLNTDRAQTIFESYGFTVK